MRKSLLLGIGAATLLALSPVAMNVPAYAASGASVGPTGSGSSEAETQGSASAYAHPKSQMPRAGSPGPTGSASAEAETQGSGPRTSVNPRAPHNSTGVVTPSSGVTGSAGTH